ncbi:hypothetical protein CR513_05376, partial [Mucuna pruriens]
MYRTLVNLLANRFSGRKILGGIIIANQLVDDAKRRKKKELVLLKVGFEKAYDLVYSEYLDYMIGNARKLLVPCSIKGWNLTFFLSYQVNDCEWVISHLPFVNDSLVLGDVNHKIFGLSKSSFNFLRWY